MIIKHCADLPKTHHERVEDMIESIRKAAARPWQAQARCLSGYSHMNTPAEPAPDEIKTFALELLQILERGKE